MASVSPFGSDRTQPLERTCFQTGQGWSSAGNLRSDVAIVYGIDPRLPDRVQTWREHGYRIHVMTGVSWGSYQDYLYGRFDGVNHEDEAQTERDGKKIVSPAEMIELGGFRNMRGSASGGTFPSSFACSA